jgi:hypothetical protein
MASACVHGSDDEGCSSCNETWEAELTATMQGLTIGKLQELQRKAKRGRDNITQRNCALAISYVLNRGGASEACTDAAREIANIVMAER